MTEKKSAVAKKAKEWLQHADEDLQLANELDRDNKLIKNIA